MRRRQFIAGVRERGRVASGGAGAEAGDAGDRVSQQWVTSLFDCPKQGRHGRRRGSACGEVQKLSTRNFHDVSSKNIENFKLGCSPTADDVCADVALAAAQRWKHGQDFARPVPGRRTQASTWSPNKRSVIPEVRHTTKGVAGRRDVAHRAKRTGCSM
jgi:hypothetical protein